MYKTCRVLVTGAGSGVGQGIIKSLRISELPLTIIGADIAPMNVALYRTDEAVIIPKVESEGALDKIIFTLKRLKIDVVMIGSEFDLMFFSSNKELIENKVDVKIIVSPIETVSIADDKWKTAEFLRKNNLPYAEVYLPKDIDEAINIAESWGYPIVLKARTGTSSRHVYIVNNRQMLVDNFSEIPLPMLQRVIALPSSNLDSEYTCSVFKSSDGCILGPFMARRTVRDGTSWHLEIAYFDQLKDVLLAIAREVEFMASLNIQLMLTKHGPVPFELNSRFSGTTAVRAHFGFNEPAMAIKNYFYGEVLTPPEIREGLAMRYHEEVFIEKISANELLPGKHKGIVNSWL